MRLLVCGDRNWTDYVLIQDSIEAWLREGHTLEVLIEGGQTGADTIAGELFMSMSEGCEPDEYLADWIRYGKKAGPIRNYQMLREGRPHVVMAFHDDLSVSKGTKHMVGIAEAAGIETRIITHSRRAPDAGSEE